MTNERGRFTAQNLSRSSVTGSGSLTGAEVLAGVTALFHVSSKVSSDMAGRFTRHDAEPPERRLDSRAVRHRLLMPKCR